VGAETSESGGPPWLCGWGVADGPGARVETEGDAYLFADCL